MPDPSKVPNTRAVIAAIGFGCLPLALWFVLNFMRPDLIAPMLDHFYGFVITGAELLLTGLGLVTYLISATAIREKRGLRIGLAIGAALLCTLPALFLVLFGPVAFAFMFGNLDAPTSR